VSLVLVTPPTTEPLGLAGAKLHLRLEPGFTDDDDLVTVLIKAAREYVEADIHRGILPQAWRLTLDRFPCGDTLDLQATDVTSITSATYVAPDGSVTAFTAYALDTDAFPARIIRDYGTMWPATRVQRNAVTIAFVLGLAADSDSVPASITAAMKLLIGNWYENREALVESRFALEVPFSVTALLSPFRRLAAEFA
jgi:uncharacterized phiE125 gp8 family phage protein